MSVYLLHFQRPYRHAQHYIGFVESLDALDDRIARHRAGRGARLVEVIVAAGIEFEVARTWPHGDRTLERRLKNRKSARKICPICRAAQSNKRGNRCAS